MVSAAEVIDRAELLWVTLEELRPNPWNPNVMDAAMYAKETESIKRFGMAVPITTRKHPDGGYEIIDGENRWKVLADLKYRHAPIWNLGWVDDAIAKQLTVVLNETKGSPEKQKLSELLKDLLKSETTDELLSVLPFSKEKFEELVDVPAFDWESFESQEPQRSENSWVERVYRLPSDAAKVLDEAIARAKEDDDTPDGIALERIAADFPDGEMPMSVESVPAGSSTPPLNVKVARSTSRARFWFCSSTHIFVPSGVAARDAGPEAARVVIALFDNCTRSIRLEPVAGLYK